MHGQSDIPSSPKLRKGLWNRIPAIYSLKFLCATIEQDYFVQKRLISGACPANQSNYKKQMRRIHDCSKNACMYRTLTNWPAVRPDASATSRWFYRGEDRRPRGFLPALQAPLSLASSRTALVRLLRLRQWARFGRTRADARPAASPKSVASGCRNGTYSSGSAARKNRPTPR